MKKAFTMIELIFVIVVAGILAAIALPRADSNNLNEAADQIVNHIRYTQHLAMQDNKFNPSDQFWYRSRWQIQFCSNNTNAGGQCRTEAGNDTWTYSIYADQREFGNYTGVPRANKLAVNPQNPSQLMSGGFISTTTNQIGITPDDERAMEELRVGDKYGIENVVFSNNCNSDASKSISFDSFGRPLYGSTSLLINPYTSGAVANANKLLFQRCTIALTANGETRVIAIEPETGYTHIL